MEDLQPEMSVIIPVLEGSQSIIETCESLFAQKGVRWEAIVIYGGIEDFSSTDMHYCQDPRIRFQTLSKAPLFALINRGLMMAQGEYVNILYPGCTYLAPTALSQCMEKIGKLKDKDLFYTASYIGDDEGVMHLYYQKEQAITLQDGLQPILLQSCFFKTAIFKKVGYFRPDLERRATFEFLCRIFLTKNIRIASEFRCFVEMERFPLHIINRWLVFKETWQVLYAYYGLRAALKWLFSKNSFRLGINKFLLDIGVTRYI